MEKLMAGKLTTRGKAWRAFVALALLATTLAGAPSQLGAQGAEAEQFVQITVENLQGEDGFFFTEVWAGLHNGDFDLFDSNEDVSPGLEVLAEDGDPANLASEFAQPGRLQTTVGNTPIFPGSEHEAFIEVVDASAYRYLSFASMMLPSNDVFFGNEVQDAYELFDAEGEFGGPVTIQITEGDLYDAGTEENNVMGLPFVPAADGTTATDTTDGATSLTDGLAPYVDAVTAPGTTIAAALAADEPVATITIDLVEQVVEEQVHVRVENLQEEDGFFFTEVWAGLHNGVDFDLFNPGEAPSAGLEALAEDGNPAVLQGEFDAPGRLQTQVGPTPIAPGSTHESSIEVINASAYQYLSFASMMLPSNDAFFGNDAPDAYQLFDDAGEFVGPVTIDVTAADLYDAGTEENDVMGLPFVPAADGTTATDTADGIALVTDGLLPYVGAVTAAGTTVGAALAAEEPIAVITVYAGPARTCGDQAVTVNLALGEEPTDDADVILGTDGDDVIAGLGGNDIICGEGGNDSINGGSGNDTIFGGDGDDALRGGRGSDTIYGQDGNDNILGQRGADELHGNDGDDTLRGGNAADSLTGDLGDDILHGNNGADTLSGNNGDDILRGGKKADTLDGGAGLDVNRGDSGTDSCAADPDGLDEINRSCKPPATEG